MSIARRFKERILHKYFVRCDMSLILGVVVASGLGASKLLLECGVKSLQWRYPLALFVSFAAFLLLIRVWIWYVFPRKPVELSADPGDIDIPEPGGGANPESVRFGGGDSGGGGASDAWEEGRSVSSWSGGSGSSRGGGGSGFDLDLDDDWAILLLLAAVILAIVCAGGYLIYTAPEVLPEAAWQATLASGLARAPKPGDRTGWLRWALRAACVPFVVVLILVVALAYVTHHHCPAAVKLAEALYCLEP